MFLETIDGLASMADCTLKHSTQYAIYSTLYTVHNTLYTVYSTCDLEPCNLN